MFYDIIIKEMGQFIRSLDKLEKSLYYNNFVDKETLNNEISKWRKFRMMIKEKYL